MTRGRAPAQRSGIGVSGGPTEIGRVVTPSIDKYFRLRGAVLAPMDGNGSESAVRGVRRRIVPLERPRGREWGWERYRCAGAPIARAPISLHLLAQPGAQQKAVQVWNPAQRMVSKQAGARLECPTINDLPAWAPPLPPSPPAPAASSHSPGTMTRRSGRPSTFSSGRYTRCVRGSTATE